MFLVVMLNLPKVNMSVVLFSFFQKWQKYEFKAKKFDKRPKIKDDFQDFRIDRIF